MNKFHLGLGDRAPNFSLPGVDHRTYSLDGLADKAVIVIVFSCNHCPYVQAYEDRLVAIQRDYAARGVQVVAINSNDDVHYPEDSLENMVTRAKAKGFNFPYLRDASQAVARAYGATHTPQLFPRGLGELHDHPGDGEKWGQGDEHPAWIERGRQESLRTLPYVGKRWGVGGGLV